MNKPTVEELKAYAREHGFAEDFDGWTTDLLTGEQKRRFTDEQIQGWIDGYWAGPKA